MSEDLDLLRRSIEESIGQMILVEVASPIHSNEIARQIREWSKTSQQVAEFGFNTNRDDASALWERCHAAVAGWDAEDPGLLLVRDDSPPDVRIAHNTSKKPTSIGFWRNMNQLREKWDTLPSQTIFLVTHQQYFFLTTEADHFKRWIPLKLHLPELEESAPHRVVTTLSHNSNESLISPFLLDDLGDQATARQNWDAYQERLRRACERGESSQTLAHRYFLPLMAAAVTLHKWPEAAIYDSRIRSVQLSKSQLLRWLRLRSRLEEAQDNVAQAVATAEERLKLAEQYEKENGDLQQPQNPGPAWNILSAINELSNLHERQKNFSEAERWLVYGLGIAPNETIFLNNYAFLLRNVWKDYDRAEGFYKHALEVNPTQAATLSNYANFLADERQEYDKAEELYKRSVKAAPKDARVLSNFAIFLSDFRRDFKRAEELFQRAIEIDSSQGYIFAAYALSLKNLSNNYEKADEYFHRAVELEPKNIVTLQSYSIFLCVVLRDFKRAMPYLRRAMEVEPEQAQHFINYAAALLIQGQKEEGKAILERAAAMSNLTDKQQVGIAFHYYIHFPGDMPSPLEALERVLKSGKRAADWTFDLNIERAQQDGHPNTKLLKALAEVIAEKKSLKTLDVFPEWLRV